MINQIADDLESRLNS